MGGVLAAAPIEQAAVGHIRAGGDLALICHKEDFILRAHEALIHEAERDRRLPSACEESARRVLAFKKKQAGLFRSRAYTHHHSRVREANPATLGVRRRGATGQARPTGDEQIEQ